MEWRPDTCNCVIQVQVENNIFTAIESVTDSYGNTYNRFACDRHASIIDVQEHYQTVLQENGRKNQVYEDILLLNPDTPQKFSIDNNGILSFTVKPYLTDLQIENLQTLYPNVIFI
jgi:hypothetical protein